MEQNTKPETWEQQKAREAVENKIKRDARWKKISAALKLAGFTPEPRKAGEESNWNAKIHLRAMREDLTIWASCDRYGNKGRFSFSVSYPNPKVGSTSTHGLPNPSITVSEDKTPEQIAGDIKRRLMPEAEAGLAKARERNASTENYHATRDANLRAVMGREKLTEYEQKEGRADIRGAADDKTYGTVKAYEDSVSLDLSNVPVPLAVKIMALVRAGR